jgi:hypothetical protein
VVSNRTGLQLPPWPAGSFTVNGSNQAVAGGTGINIAVVVDSFRNAPASPLPAGDGFTPSNATISATVDVSGTVPNGRYGGVVARWGAGSAWNDLITPAPAQMTSAGMGYVGLIYHDTAPQPSNLALLGKMIGNQLILLAAPVSLGSATSGTVKLVIAGSSLQLFFNNVLQTSAPDSSITTGWGAGIVDFGGGTKFSSFSATDPTLPFFDVFAGPTLGGAWTVNQGSFTVSNHRAVSGSGRSHASLNDVSVADVLLQADVTAGSTGAALFARYDAATGNEYQGVLTADGMLAIVRVYDGTSMVLASAYVGATSATMTFALSGSSLSLSFGGTTLTATDTLISSPGLLGIEGLGSGAAFGNFYARGQ